uniref:ubiquitinyl hydrolase 1 n=1 Tax=Ascaris lumbricoides TaxID=6252 RepID=A0A0M3INP6_ASCLU
MYKGSCAIGSCELSRIGKIVDVIQADVGKKVCDTSCPTGGLYKIFLQDPSSTFGVPFFVKVIDGESFEGVSERIRRKLGVSEQDFSKAGISTVVGNVFQYKLAIIVNNCVRGYPDKQSAVSLNELAQTHLSGLPDKAYYVTETVTAPWLGLDHTDKARGTGGTHTIERAIVIRN